MNSFVVLSAILGATMAAPAAQLVAGHGLVGAGYAGLGLAGHAGLAGVGPAVNVHAVHTTVPVAVPTATVHKTVQTHLVPQTRLVGHQVSHSVHHVPRVHTETKTSTHTTHHVINHPPA